MSDDLELIAPGEVLMEEFLKPLGISQNKLARDLDVPLVRVNGIVHGRRGVSADTALRLAAYFGTTAEFWVNLQSSFELKLARRENGARIAAAVRPLRAA